jgi:hypothetical protein
MVAVYPKAITIIVVVVVHTILSTRLIGPPITVVILSIANFRCTWINQGIFIIAIASFGSSVASFWTTKAFLIGCNPPTIAIKVKVVRKAAIRIFVICDSITIIIDAITDLNGRLTPLTHHLPIYAFTHTLAGANHVGYVAGRTDQVIINFTITIIVYPIAALALGPPGITLAIAGSDSGTASKNVCFVANSLESQRGKLFSAWASLIILGATMTTIDTIYGVKTTLKTIWTAGMRGTRNSTKASFVTSLYASVLAGNNTHRRYTIVV